MLVCSSKCVHRHITAQHLANLLRAKIVAVVTYISFVVELQVDAGSAPHNQVSASSQDVNEYLSQSLSGTHELSLKLAAALDPIMALPASQPNSSTEVLQNYGKGFQEVEERLVKSLSKEKEKKQLATQAEVNSLKPETQASDKASSAFKLQNCSEKGVQSASTKTRNLALPKAMSKEDEKLLMEKLASLAEQQGTRTEKKNTSSGCQSPGLLYRCAAREFKAVQHSTSPSSPKLKKAGRPVSSKTQQATSRSISTSTPSRDTASAKAKV